MKCLIQSQSNQCFTCTIIPTDEIKVKKELTRVLRALNWAYDSLDSTMTLPSETAILDLEREEGSLHYPPTKREFSQLALTDTVSAYNIEKPKKVRAHIEYLG